MSFEAWCHVTAYDPEHPTGGPKFQHRMQLLLTPSTPKEFKAEQSDILWWDAENQAYGDVFNAQRQDRRMRMMNNPRLYGENIPHDEIDTFKEVALGVR